MDPGQRDIYARYVLDLLRLSKCSNPRAAIIAGGKRGIICSAYSNPIIPGKSYESSPIMDIVFMALQMYVGLKDEKENEEYVIVSTYFPSFEDFMLLIGTNIRVIRYMGEVEDEKTVKFLNEHTVFYPEGGFEIIKFVFDKKNS